MVGWPEPFSTKSCGVLAATNRKPAQLPPGAPWFMKMRGCEMFFGSPSLIVTAVAKSGQPSLLKSATTTSRLLMGCMSPWSPGVSEATASVEVRSVRTPFSFMNSTPRRLPGVVNGSLRTTTRSVQPSRLKSPTA